MLVCLILSMILSSMIGTYAENRYNARIATQLAEEKAIKDALDAKIKLKNSMIHTGVLEPTPASIPTHTGQVFIQ